MLQQPLQTAGRVRLPYTRRRSDARCVTSASQLPDVPELKAYGPDFFTDHALLLVSDTTASGSLRPTLHTADITDGRCACSTLYRPGTSASRRTWPPGSCGRRSLSLGPTSPGR